MRCSEVEPGLPDAILQNASQRRRYFFAIPFSFKNITPSKQSRVRFNTEYELILLALCPLRAGSVRLLVYVQL